MIRPLQPRDIPQCAALLERLPDWFGIPESNANYIAGLHRLPAFADELEDRVVGFLAIERYGDVAAEITVMAVDPSVHRRGIGAALVRTAEEWSAQNGVRWLHVKTRGPSTYDEEYEQTRRFYRAQGFDPLYESLTEWGPANAALFLVKRVGT